MTNDTTPLSYARPDKNLPAKEIASLACGAGGIAMNLLLWEGIFADNSAVVPLTAAFVTVTLPFAGIVLAVLAGGRSLFGWLGAAISLASLGTSVILLVYFLQHLPTC